jgi:hypothetical protein
VVADPGHQVIETEEEHQRQKHERRAGDTTEQGRLVLTSVGGMPAQRDVSAPKWQ